MKPWLTCVLGMMIGSIVLIWGAIFKPHDLDYQLNSNEKIVFYKKGFDI